MIESGPDSSTEKSDSFIECSNVTFCWPSNEPDDTPTLENISLSIKKGEFVSIIGASGCGKSTLLNVLSGVRQANSGSVSFNGNVLLEPSQKIGLVFQDYGLFSWLNIQDNIEFGMKINGIDKNSCNTKSKYLLEQIQLADQAKKYPHELSGGMRQRVAIMRAVANDPDIILMDEPFGALDYKTRLSMNKLLLHIWENTGKTIIFVTHDIEESILLSDRIFLMSPNPGRIKEVLNISLPRPRSASGDEFYKLQSLIRHHLE